jgi:hypothetical protein
MEFFKPTRRKIALTVIVSSITYLIYAIPGFFALDLHGSCLPHFTDESTPVYNPSSLQEAWQIAQSTCPTPGDHSTIVQSIRLGMSIWSFAFPVLSFIIFFYLISCMVVFLRGKLKKQKQKKKRTNNTTRQLGGQPQLNG